MNTAVVIDETDEIASEGVDISTSLAVSLTRAEIDVQITTARTYPRSLKHVANRIMSLATLDEESAEECMYALPRAGKPIKGPSIRFAEIVRQAFGNCRAAARVVHVDRAEKYVEAEGVFHDLETNSATSARVRRRIVDSKGRLYSDDMIIVTGNAACSIALRNAILAGVPKPLWRKAYDAVQSAVSGDITTLAVRREQALKGFAHFGVKPEQVFAALGVVGEDDVTVDHITVLFGMFSALRSGEATVEEMFSPPVQALGKPDVAARLRTQPADPGAAKPEGFSAVKADILDGDDIPESVKQPAEIPGMKTGAQLLAEQQQRPTLVDRALGLETSLRNAPDLIALSDAWDHSADLRTELDASDPDRLAELQALMNEREEALGE